MNLYHFSDHSFSDMIVPAIMVAPEAVDSYHFEHKTYPNIYIRNRGLAMHLSFLEEDSDEIKELREAVEEYNEYLTKLEAIPGFIEYFKRHGFCVSKEEVARQWPEETADLVFLKKDFCFDTELSIVDGYLFDQRCPVKYKAEIDGATIFLPIGKNAEAYPDCVNGKKAIWNWVDNGHDFCFALWELLGERSRQNEDDEEADGVQYYFEVYDQIRSEPVEPQLANVFRHLQNTGYIQTYTIRPDRKDPRWNYYGKTDGSIDLALVDLSFLKDDLLLKQVEYQLWKPIDEEYVEVEAECSSEKENGHLCFSYGIERNEYKWDRFINEKEIAEGICDYFSENTQEFESGMMKAKKLIEEGKQTSIRSALFETYGHFGTTFIVDGIEKEPDYQIDIEKLIYDSLEEAYSWF